MWDLYRPTRTAAHTPSPGAAWVGHHSRDGSRRPGDAPGPSGRPTNDTICIWRAGLLTRRPAGRARSFARSGTGLRPRPELCSLRDRAEAEAGPGAEGPRPELCSLRDRG